MEDFLAHVVALDALPLYSGSLATTLISNLKP
jgi:hypothetical protein